MKYKLLLVISVFFYLQGFGQIAFEKGCIIDNSGKKIECFIKNVDWVYNPKVIEYRLVQDGKSSMADVESIQEFEIYSEAKFVKKSVNIDLSNESIGSLSVNKNPEFANQKLFLKVLFQGQATLYQFKGDGLLRFFYTAVDSSDIQQLVYKNYLLATNVIATNNQFKQQLWQDLKCDKIDIKAVEKLEYNKKDLLNFFQMYSKCMNPNLVVVEAKEDKKGVFHLSLKARLNNASAMVQNRLVPSTQVVFNNLTSPGFGVEVEYTFPFNKNKWSVLIDPSFQKFSSQKMIRAFYYGGTMQDVSLNYNSFEVPVMVRHYMFVNNNSKIFIDAAFVYGVSMNSNIQFVSTTHQVSDDLRIIDKGNVAFGMGYKFRDKYSVEMRYQMDRELLNSPEDLQWKSKYNGVSLIVGYSLF